MPRYRATATVVWDFDSPLSQDEALALANKHLGQIPTQDGMADARLVEGVKPKRPLEPHPRRGSGLALDIRREQEQGHEKEAAPDDRGGEGQAGAALAQRQDVGHAAAPPECQDQGQRRRSVDHLRHQPLTFTRLRSRKPLPLVLQRLPAKRATVGSETAGSPLG
jgi:hypothetical protein